MNTLFRKGRTLSLVLVLALSFVTVGTVSTTSSCSGKQTQVVNVPENVSPKTVVDWYAATGALKRVADVSNEVTKGVIELNKAGVLPDSPAYVAFLQTMARVSAAGRSAATVLDAMPENFEDTQRAQIKQILTGVADELQTLNTQGFTNIKNPDSLTEINRSISLLKSAMQMVLSL